MANITIYHVQRAITPKAGTPQLSLLCSAHRFMVANISLSFVKKISPTIFKLRGRHNFMTKITIYNIQSVIIPTESKPVMVLAFCTSSDGGKNFCKVS